MKNKFIFLTFLAIFALCFGDQIALAGSATVSWNANTESDISGYKIYYGVNQRTGTDPKTCGLCGYTNTVNAGNIRTYTFSNLTDGQRYYFSVSAYDTSNNESVFSSEQNKIISSLSTKFTAGQRIQTTSNLNVRATAGATGTLLGTQSLGSLGTIVSGGQSADGYFWWNVNYDSGVDGYSVEDYMKAYTAAILGDLNSDGLVNSIDLSLLTSKWNQNYPAYDLSPDGIINSLDYAILSSHWSL